MLSARSRPVAVPVPSSVVGCARCPALLCLYSLSPSGTPKYQRSLKNSVVSAFLVNPPTYFMSNLELFAGLILFVRVRVLLQGPGGKMSSSMDSSAIFVTDTPKQVKDSGIPKVHFERGGRAFSCCRALRSLLSCISLPPRNVRGGRLVRV